MASDELNRVGKYIRDTREDVNYALSRYKPILHTVERTRDIFDPELSFVMTFRTYEQQKTVKLTVFFNKPPPLSECKTGCRLNASCQSYTGSGNVILAVDNIPYNANTVDVFVNGVQLSYPQFSEYNSTTGEVYVQTPVGAVNTITICYMYGECSE